jgi:hypothetical protein
MVIILDLFHQASVQISLIVKAGHQKQTVLKRFYRKIGTTNMKGANGNGIGNVINNPNTVRQGLADTRGSSMFFNGPKTSLIQSLS